MKELLDFSLEYNLVPVIFCTIFIARGRGRLATWTWLAVLGAFTLLRVYTAGPISAPTLFNFLALSMCALIYLLRLRQEQKRRREPTEV